MSKSRLHTMPKGSKPFFPTEFQEKLRNDDVVVKEEIFSDNTSRWSFVLYNEKHVVPHWNLQRLFIPLETTKNRKNTLEFFEDVRKFLDGVGAELLIECTRLDKVLVDVCGILDHRWRCFMISFRHRENISIHASFDSYMSGMFRESILFEFSDKDSCKQLLDEKIEEILTPVIDLLSIDIELLPLDNADSDTLIESGETSTSSNNLKKKPLLQSRRFIDESTRVIIDDEIQFHVTTDMTVSHYKGKKLAIDRICEKIVMEKNALLLRALEGFEFNCLLFKNDIWVNDNWTQQLRIHTIPQDHHQRLAKQRHLDLLDLSTVFVSHLPIYIILWISDWLHGMIYWKEFDKIRLIDAVKASVDRAVLRREPNSKKQC